jgi:hypothetical protein
MEEGVDITKITGSNNLLTRKQAELVLDYLKENPKVRDLNMKKVEACTSAFVNFLIYHYNKSKKFDRYSKLIFFNVKNPVVVLKIQEAQFEYFDKKTAKRNIKIHEKILNEVLNS